MPERALSFGSVASAYERFRPGYPDELVDEVLAYASRAVRTALEIGAGTGKATRVFARRGIAVTATDPDQAMLRELRKHVPEAVATVQATFEDLPLTPVYDLAFAAASLHWTEPDHRWSRVAAMLKRDGIFASFGGQMHLADSDVERAVWAARSQFLADDEVPPPDGTPAGSPMQWPGTELAQSDQFTDVRQTSIERRATISARDYVGHLSTISAYLELPDPVREDVLGRILEVLPQRVTLVADITLHLARVG
ncbi:MAG TPA: class I SAM-dependent methyltransferase [Actinomycetes bacterium]|jgi:SAM-dependent methyltransferase|nr:class I SAM-dependent methyltransferase [Actinomycetes bacterium]